jgi:hypothetical protein
MSTQYFIFSFFDSEIKDISINLKSQADVNKFLVNFFNLENIFEEDINTIFTQGFIGDNNIDLDFISLPSAKIKKIQLTKDITLTLSSNNNLTKNIKILQDTIFDGNNYTITGNNHSITIEKSGEQPIYFQGLFYLKNGTVTNLNIVQNQETSKKLPLMNGHGFLIRSNPNQNVNLNTLTTNYTNSIGFIDNCTITGDIPEHSGGICGKYAGNNGILRITNSNVNAYSIGKSSGGICAEYAGSNGLLSIVNCKVSFKDEFSSFIIGDESGGICGSYAGNQGILNIYNCHYAGKIGINGGGLTGSYTSSNGNVHIINCGVKARIEGYHHNGNTITSQINNGGFFCGINSLGGDNENIYSNLIIEYSYYIPEIDYEDYNDDLSNSIEENEYHSYQYKVGCVGQWITQNQDFLHLVYNGYMNFKNIYTIKPTSFFHSDQGINNKPETISFRGDNQNQTRIIFTTMKFYVKDMNDVNTHLNQDNTDVEQEPLYEIDYVEMAVKDTNSNSREFFVQILDDFSLNHLQVVDSTRFDQITINNIRRNYKYLIYSNDTNFLQGHDHTSFTHFRLELGSFYLGAPLGLLNYGYVYDPQPSISPFNLVTTLSTMSVEELSELTSSENISNYQYKVFDGRVFYTGTRQRPVGDNTDNIKRYLTPGGEWNVNMSIQALYIFLDDNERQFFANNTHQYIFDQVIEQKFEKLYGEGNHKIYLEQSKPVKEIIFTPYRSDYIKTNRWSNFTNKENENANMYQFQDFIWNYINKSVGDGYDYIYPFFKDISGDLLMSPDVYLHYLVVGQQTPFGIWAYTMSGINGFGASSLGGKIWLSPTNNYQLSYTTNPPFWNRTLIELPANLNGPVIELDVGSNFYSSSGQQGAFFSNDQIEYFRDLWEYLPLSQIPVITNDNYKQFDENIIDSAEIIFDSNIREMRKNYIFFNGVQPYLYHSSGVNPGIYSYSFGLTPEKYQPSGACNFSNIKDCIFNLEFKKPYILKTLDDEDFWYGVRFFSVAQNLFQCASGMGGRVYAN